MREEQLGHDARVRAAEVIATLSLACDLGTGLPLEHGLDCTLLAMRLADRLDVDLETAKQTYYGCLLFYVGCTADADVAARLFEGGLHEHYVPALFGSPAQLARAVVASIPPPGASRPARAVQVLARAPAALTSRSGHLVAICEVGQMLTERLGLPAAVQAMFTAFTARWDGKGFPRVAGQAIPEAVRIVHVARDAVVQRNVGGADHAVRMLRERAGGAFDPEIALALASSPDLLEPEPAASLWDDTLAREPGPAWTLAGPDVDRAVAAMADFADLISPHLAGHSSGVAALAAAAGRAAGLRPDERDALRRAALLHDIGRVAVPTRIWLAPRPLRADEWERVRLHAYHSERVLSRSPFFARLARLAGGHHERLDGSGYHRGALSAELTPATRVLAAADTYHALTEPRPHRDALLPGPAGRVVGEEVAAGRLDGDAVAAVLQAAGQPVPRLARPAGLTDREAQVVGMLARGMPTKQVARVLGISVKTADRHVQNAYAKIGVSSRAALTLFAMEHGLLTWGELPMSEGVSRS